MIWERKQSTVSEDIIHMSEDRKEWWNSSTYKTIGRLEIIGKESCFKHLEIVNNFPGGSDICLKCGKPRFDPWIGKISWRRRWQPTPVLLPGIFHEWRSLVGYSPWGHKESDTTERLHFKWIDEFTKVNLMETERNKMLKMENSILNYRMPQVSTGNKC